MRRRGECSLSVPVHSASRIRLRRRLYPFTAPIHLFTPSPRSQVLLRSIDGVACSDQLVVVGATNRTGDMDAALRSRFAHAVLLRTRVIMFRIQRWWITSTAFSPQVRFALPGAAAREAILAGLACQLDPRARRELAAQTERFSGRDLRDVCEQVRVGARRRAPPSLLPPPAFPHDASAAVLYGQRLYKQRPRPRAAPAGGGRVPPPLRGVCLSAVWLTRARRARLRARYAVALL